MGTGSFPGVKSGRGVTLTSHPLLVPWSRKGRAIPLLPLWAVQPVQSLIACTRVHFTFYLSGRLLGRGFPQSQDLYRCFQTRPMPKHADVIIKYKPSYALCTLLRNADHLSVGHLAVNTAINVHDLISCWASGAVLYIVQTAPVFCIVSLDLS